MNYEQDARDDARCFLSERVGEIVDQIETHSTPQCDPYDFSGGDRALNEITDEWYSLLEAATLLDELSDYEETDSGLWEGMDPRDAIRAMATYTYLNAVSHFIADTLEEIRDNVDINEIRSTIEESNLVDLDSEVREEIRKQVTQIIGG